MNAAQVIVIGAGPAGLMCAIRCAAQGLSVAILEKNDTAGKKLLITGSGRCNISHCGSVGDFLLHYGGNGRFVKPALFNFTNQDLQRFFDERNLKIADAGDGKLFPVTNRSDDILKSLLDECAGRSIPIVYNSPVTAIGGTTAGFAVSCGEKKYRTGNIVIAAGGASYPLTGSSGDGYSLAENLGHSIAPPAPALVQVIINDYEAFRPCAGISLKEAKLFIHSADKKIRESQGDVLFTHAGLSGPGILDLSRYVRAGDVIKIALVNNDNRETFEKKLIIEFAKNGKLSVKKRLSQYNIPGRLLVQALSLCKITPELNAGSIDKKTRMLLADVLTGLPFVVQQTGDFSDAMVTRGGVALDEIDKNTMESRIVKGLYFAGEVMDVDGDTGGYNLQFAFSSGVLAARRIIQSIG